MLCRLSLACPFSTPKPLRWTWPVLGIWQPLLSRCSTCARRRLKARPMWPWGFSAANRGESRCYWQCLWVAVSPHGSLWWKNQFALVRGKCHFLGSASYCDSGDARCSSFSATCLVLWQIMREKLSAKKSIFTVASNLHLMHLYLVNFERYVRKPTTPVPYNNSFKDCEKKRTTMQRIKREKPLCAYSLQDLDHRNKG